MATNSYRRGRTPAPSQRVYLGLRAAVMHGEVAPRAPLKPQELAIGYGVSLAVVREALLRLVGEGLAERLPNRGFAVPAADARRWQEIAEARSVIDPMMARMAVVRGDLEWEAGVRAAHHRLARTPVRRTDGHVSDAWAEAHRVFHRSVVEGCRNEVLLATFDRLWTASELARRWSELGAPELGAPEREGPVEHRELEAAVVERDSDRAADVLARHLGVTAAALLERAKIGDGDAWTSGGS